MCRIDSESYAKGVLEIRKIKSNNGVEDVGVPNVVRSKGQSLRVRPSQVKLDGTRATRRKQEGLVDVKKREEQARRAGEGRKRARHLFSRREVGIYVNSKGFDYASMEIWLSDTLTH